MKDYFLKPFPNPDSPYKVSAPTNPARLAGDDNAERAALSVGQCGSHIPGAASPSAPDPFSGAVPHGTEPDPAGAIRVSPSTDRTAVTDPDLRDAEERAAACREFLRLTQQEHFSLVGAAKALGRSPSQFSGRDSMLARYLRGGVAALVKIQNPESRIQNLSDLTKQIESLGWFIPAARFFYSQSNLSDGRGSVPEAIRRTISLPNLPTGWKTAMREKFLKAIHPQITQISQIESATSAKSAKSADLPVCPVELREAILAREKAGQPFVPERISRQIIVNPSVIGFHRGPRNWELNNLSAPGSQRRFTNDEGRRVIMQPGDWFGGDDATPGIAVCVPCNEVITPCSQKFGVLLGRFQWLAYHDCRTDKILSWDYVVRPRGSYRFEDILNGMGSVSRVHGIPRQGWQFEGGTFNAKLVQEAIRLMGCEHWRTYSPHQKAIESVFNRVWTRLAVQFPHADMGRFRAENESNSKLYMACKAGHQDPRRYFPTLSDVVAAFEEEVMSHNTRHITSEQYGRWIPDDYFDQAVTARPLRAFSRDMDWIFSPYAVERKVRSMMVRCRVPMFEDFSVPFEFNADWMPMFTGRSVRIHFDPRTPRCTAKVVLLESFGTHKAGEILGDAQLIGETSGHIRFIMGYGIDDQRGGYLARQRTANYMRRVTRGVGLGGRAEYTKDEQRDGIASVQTFEKDLSAGSGSNRPETDQPEKPTRASADEVCQPAVDRTNRLREIEEFERQNQHLFA